MLYADLNKKTDMHGLLFEDNNHHGYGQQPTEPNLMRSYEDARDG